MRGVMRVTSMVSGVFAGQLSSAVIQAISMVILARATNPQSFGRAIAVIAAATVLMALIDVGLGTLAVRTAARDHHNFELATTYQITLIFSVLLSTLVCLGVIILGSLDGGYYLFAPLAGWMIVEKQLSLRCTIAVASGRVAASTRSLIISRIASLLSFCLMLWLHLPPSLSYTLGYTVGSSVGLALVIRSSSFEGAAHKPSINMIRTLARPMLRRSGPFFVATLSYQLRTLDVTIVSLISGPTAAGIYAVPARLSAPVRLLPTVLNSLTMPIVSGGNPHLLRQLVRLIRMTWAGLIIVLGILILFAETIIVSLVGEAYRTATLPLRILAVGIAMNIVGASRSAMLQASGDEGFVAKMGIVVGLTSIGAVASGAHWGGAVGAAIGMTGTYLLQLVVVSCHRVRPVAAYA